MSETLTTAKNLLLMPASLDEGKLQTFMDKMLKGRHIDEADLYFQTVSAESWYLEDREVKSGSYASAKGVGIRVVSGDKTGYAYCDEIALPTMERAVAAARSLTIQSTTSVMPTPTHKSNIAYYEAINPLESLTKAEKIAILQEVDTEARRADPRVIQVNAQLDAEYEAILIVNREGHLVADVRPLICIHVTVIVEENGRREKGRSGGGGRSAYQYFLEQNRARHFAREAVREALINLEAIDAPAGLMPVVLGPGWPGVLLHEAVGHGLEGDFNRKGLSAFSGHLGELVASPCVTVVDNGTLPNRRGSLTVDDEGTPTQCTTLIENGILVNYMQDRLNAKLMGMKPTGNCRRESYAHVPMPRMTNTYMLNGEHTAEEIIASVSRGLYAVNFSGGQVDITSGQFVFSASEAYLIENGKITVPVKGATLIGNGPAVMKQVSMVGNDLQLDSGIGVCGKEGQSVPVGVGQPTLKIDALTVGGTRFE